MNDNWTSSNYNFCDEKFSIDNIHVGIVCMIDMRLILLISINRCDSMDMLCKTCE